MPDGGYRCFPVARAGSDTPGQFPQECPPGASLRIEAQILSCNRSMASASAKIWWDEHVVAEAVLSYGFIAKNLLQPGFQDEVLTAYLASHQTAFGQLAGASPGSAAVVGEEK